MIKQLVTERELDADYYHDCHLPSAERLGRILQRDSTRVVLAESCTAGWAAAALGAIPGISNYFCGSVVTYRDRAKTDLLDVQARGLKQWTGVSFPIAAQMAYHVLQKASEADYAASVTGNLGPSMANERVAAIFVGLAWRDQGEVKLYRVNRQTLTEQTRLARRVEAAELLLNQLADCVEATQNINAFGT